MRVAVETATARRRTCTATSGALRAPAAPRVPLTPTRLVGGRYGDCSRLCRLKLGDVKLALCLRKMLRCALQQ